MNYLSYNVLSLLSSSPSITATSVTSNDDEAAAATTTTTTIFYDEDVRQRIEAACTTDDDNDTHDDKNDTNMINVHEEIPPIFTLRDILKNDAEFQIQSTIHSWSFCWNRGDIVGYCDGYHGNDDHSQVNPMTTRYISVSRHGKMTCLLGATNITKFLTRVFEQCSKYQSKVIQEESSNSTSSSRSAVAGYLEYSHLQIQFIPSVTSTNDAGNESNSIATTQTNHAIVFGHYTLDFSPNNIHNEQGVFTLHLIQNIPSFSLSTKWQIKSEHSSALQI